MYDVSDAGNISVSDLTYFSIRSYLFQYLILVSNTRDFFDRIVLVLKK
jgi:hypothetical protein